MQNPKPLRMAIAPFCAALAVSGCRHRVPLVNLKPPPCLARPPIRGQASFRNARVSLANLDTGTTQSTTHGRLPATISFWKCGSAGIALSPRPPGFKKLETAEFRVAVGARQRVDVKLPGGRRRRDGAGERSGGRRGARFERSRPGDQSRGRGRSAVERPLQCLAGAAGAGRAAGLRARQAGILVQRERTAQPVQQLHPRWRG